MRIKNIGIEVYGWNPLRKFFLGWVVYTGYIKGIELSFGVVSISVIYVPENLDDYWDDDEDYA